METVKILDRYRLLSVSLRLFDGEGAGAATAAGSAIGSGTAANPEHTPQGSRTQSGGASRNSGGTQTRPGGNAGSAGASDAGRIQIAGDGTGNGAAGKTEGSPAKGDAAAGEAGAEKPASPEAKRAAFRALIQGEYREQYAEETRRLIDRRFREGRENAEQAEKTRNLLGLLGQRYGVDAADLDALTRAAEDDNLYWTAEAEREGMDVDHLKRLRLAEREAERLRRREETRQREAAMEQTVRSLREEGEALQGKYPAFRLEAELENPQFLGMLRSGVPMEAAYQALHYTELAEGIRSQAAAEAERRVTENVRARGGRPLEAGAGQPGAFTVRTDVSRLSREEMEDIKRRVLRGETVTLS